MVHPTQKSGKRRPGGSQPKPVQPDNRDQSGSTGRHAPDGTKPQGADTGQGRYGQSGFGGDQHHETEGESRYRNSEKDGDPRSKQRSNRGSGRADADESENPQKPDGDAADIPKTG